MQPDGIWRRAVEVFNTEGPPAESFGWRPATEGARGATTMFKIVRATLIALALALPITQTVAAHNAGHVILPSGRCIEIAAFNDVFPGPGKDVALDLIPETPYPRDEIGVSFAASRGNTPIFPGPCGVG